LLKRLLGAIMVIVVFFSSVAQLVYNLGAIRIDFDSIVDEIRPVHNIGRMPEYKVDSEVNSYFTEANMTSCRTHDIRETDIRRIFPDFSKDVNDERAYTFEECDAVLASIVDTGMVPFFRLGISYSDPVADSKDLQPPSDYMKWAQVCEHIIRHYNEGWANGFYYGIEYWEIWNEPDGSDIASENVFWQGTAEEYYELYDVSATYLKSKFPGLKIGGYGSCGFYALTKTNAVNTGASTRYQYFISFFEGFLDYISEHNSPMDFFSWHTYTSTENNAQYIKYVREKLESIGYNDTEIICDEWNYDPIQNDKIDRRHGAKQTSMLLMYQNEGLDRAYFYSGICNPNSLYGGLFVGDRKLSASYYGFWSFGQLYKLGNQAEIKNKLLPEDLYAVAATGEDGQALLISNISKDKDRRLWIDAGEYKVDKCMTVNENCEWVEIPLPEKIESGSMLYITFKK